MRALVVSIWVFINLVFFGMCSYMYLLWSQYWMSLETEGETTTSTYDQQIYFYNRGYYPSDLKNQTVVVPDAKDLLKQSQSLVKDNSSSVTLIKNSMPRFPNLQPQNFDLGTKKYQCIESDSPNDCDIKTSEFKDNLLKELRRVFTEETNVLKPGNENRYNVQFRGVRGNFMDKTPSQLRCELLQVPLRTLKRFDVRSHNLKDYLPKRGFFENKRFNTCAIVASSGALKGSRLGKFIDSHDLVLRFNNAPTKGYEDDVGNKTTVRLLNSQVVTKEQFKFLRSDLFKNITIVAWDPSNYTSTLTEWLAKPEYNLLPNYIEFKKSNPKARVYLVNPLDVWRSWEFLQGNSPGRLRKNPPSSGFIGLKLLLPVCKWIDFFEYVPSARATKRCHYYDPENNPACTFGVWHPLAAEKLLTYYINSASDRDVFQRGFVRIDGLERNDCRELKAY